MKTNIQSIVQDINYLNKLFSEATKLLETNPNNIKFFCIQEDNPIVTWLSNNEGCLLMKDFKRTVAYKSMWEEEKKQFADLKIECFVSLKDAAELVGSVLLEGG